MRPGAHGADAAGMKWLRQHAWWGLLLMAVTLVLFGVSDLLVGAPADPGIALGLSGKTMADLEEALGEHSA